VSDNKTHSIGQICELLNVEDFNLRYIEKAVNLEIKRNELGERVYSERDVETLRMILELKDQGLNYKAIKKVLEHQQESAVEKEEDNQEEGLIINEDKLSQFMIMIKNTIDESIENKVNSRLESITNKLDNLEKQNEELKEALVNEREKHFVEIDKKLIKWREDQEEKNKPWFKKIFT
jgi:MerR family transcriptional regulator, aldehyde-responsive regulator